MSKEIIKIDCLGDMCPLPVLRAMDALKKIRQGESFMLVTDHSCVVQSIKEKHFAGSVAISFDEVINGVWEITFTKQN